MKAHDLMKKLIYREKYNSDTYIAYLRKKGITIGDDCTIYVPTKTFIDTQYPFLINIGNHVKITLGVIILTHDYSWSVLQCYENTKGHILGASGQVNIGDNVFLGMNSIICRGVNIGNNVIIGAGSVVTKDCESNYVYAGNPARKICSLSEFITKRKEKQVSEAVDLARAYYDKYGTIPEKKLFTEYFMLFSDEKEVMENPLYFKKMELGDDLCDGLKYLRENERPFRDFKEFIQFCFREEIKEDGCYKRED